MWDQGRCVLPQMEPTSFLTTAILIFSKRYLSPSVSPETKRLPEEIAGGKFYNIRYRNHKRATGSKKMITLSDPVNGNCEYAFDVNSKFNQEPVPVIYM